MQKRKSAGCSERVCGTPKVEYFIDRENSLCKDPVVERTNSPLKVRTENSSNSYLYSAF